MTLLDLPPNAAIEWPRVEAWLEDIVPARALAETPQDPEWHAEGDVWTHTKLVLEALVALPSYAGFDAAVRPIVAAGALLHDIGKPSTTTFEPASEDDGRESGNEHPRGRWTSRGHSARGDHLARIALWRLGVPFATREAVCALIRSHQVPFFGITKPAGDATRLAVRLSLAARNDWLTAVAEADARGRACRDPADRQRIIEHCALWAEHCRELGVLDRAQPFPDAHTRRIYFESAPGARQPEVPVYDDTTCEVVLMCGLPASGKDHYLRTARPELPVISLDDLRGEDLDHGQVIALARERAREYLRAKTSFAWNATNLTTSLRGQLLELFRDYRARTHIVYCEATCADQLARNRARPEPVPAAVIDRMLDRWTVPDITEAHAVTYILPGRESP